MPSTSAAENEPSISAKTKIAAPSTPGATSGSVTRSIVRQRPAPMTCDASSSDGSIDFITAPIITNATDPSNSAITQAMPDRRGDVDQRALCRRRCARAG